MVVVLLVACRQAQPTPTAAPTFTRPTITPTWTPPPLPPATPRPLPTPTIAPIPSDTPTPGILVHVRNEAGRPVIGAIVQLEHSDTGTRLEAITGETGTATFTDVPPATTAYSVTANAPGYLPGSAALVVAGPAAAVEIVLMAGLPGRVTAPANLRSGPGLAFDVLGVLAAEETLVVVGMDSDGEWFSVIAAGELRGWVSAELVEVEGDVRSLGGSTRVPLTPTPFMTPGNM